MKKIIFIFLIIIALTAIVLTPNFDKNESDQESKIAHLVYTYQDTYVGDNSSVGGILNGIFLSNHISSFKLGTTKEPYSITVNYTLDQKISEDKLCQYMEYNATTLFALVKNVGVITFNVEDTIQKTYAFKRETIQIKYDEELSNYITEEKIWMEQVFLNIIK